MKIRIKGNSIRYRLKQPEVALFKKTGLVEETIAFGTQPNDQLHFRLELFSEPQLSIRYNEGMVTIYVPKALAQHWTETELVGFEGDLDSGKGRNIFVLVEKDFACLDGTEEENEGTYPNPLINCQPTESHKE